MNVNLNRLRQFSVLRPIAIAFRKHSWWLRVLTQAGGVFEHLCRHSLFKRSPASRCFTLMDTGKGSSQKLTNMSSRIADIILALEKVDAGGRRL
jgi:hypothetical protein